MNIRFLHIGCDPPNALLNVIKERRKKGKTIKIKKLKI